LLDTSKALANIGMNGVEGGINLLSGALPWGSDYKTIFSRYEYDTPAFGDLLELAVPLRAMRGAASTESELFGICFIGGTPVYTPSGIKRIEDVRPGDTVNAVQLETGETVQRSVVRIFRNLDQPIIRVIIRDKAGKAEALGVTAEHPFWVNGKDWVPARLLQANDELLSARHEEWRVEAVVDNGERADTFNFEVQELHNYLVGKNGILVHNASKVDFQGGAHGNMKGFSGRESHHMPADAASSLSKNQGPAIQMDIADHKKTASWGSSREARAYRAEQAERIKAGDFAGAQRMDIQDIRSKFGAKYDAAIKQMIEYTKKLGF